MNGTIKTLFLASVILASAWIGPRSACGSTAVILTAPDDATVISGGATAKATPGRPLKPGDTLKAASGPISVLLSNGKMETVKAGSVYTLPSDSAPAPGGQEGFASRVMAAVADAIAKDEAPLIAGMVRGNKEIDLLRPCNTMITAAELGFAWKAKDGIEQTELVIKALTPAYKYAMPIRAGETNAALPANAPQLEAGARYYWKVREPEAGMGIPPAESDLCWFGIIKPEDLKAVDDGVAEINQMNTIEPGNRVVMKAALMSSFGLQTRALAELEAHAAEHPNHTLLKRMIKAIRRGISEAAPPPSPASSTPEPVPSPPSPPPPPSSLPVAAVPTPPPAPVAAPVPVPVPLPPLTPKEYPAH